MSFIIEINGKDITSIEDLRDNFDIDILLNYKDNFEDWLAGWDYYDEAAQVRELPPDLSDNAWLEQIVQILNVPPATVEDAKQRRLQKIAQAAEEEKRKRQEEEKQHEADEKKVVSIPITRDNISIEILPETNQKLPAVCGTQGDSLWVINEDGWFLSPTSNKLFKSTDCGKSWEQIAYFGTKIFCSNNYWITSEDDRIKFSSDLKEWRDVSGPTLSGDDKILFDGKNYVALKKNYGDYGYWIWRSENLTEWQELASYGYVLGDAIFHKSYYILQSMGLDGSCPNICIADSLEKLCLPLKTRYCQDFTADGIGRFIGCAGEKFLLTKGTNSFGVTRDFNEFHYFTGAVTAVDDLIVSCDDDGFWVSSVGKPKTWRKMNIKPPFKVDKLAYRNGLLVMYNGDYSQVCVAKVYADDVEFIMPLEESLLEFARGFVCKGSIKQGTIKVGDFVDVCDKSEKKLISAKVLEIEQSGKKLEIANKGDKVAVLLPPEDDIFIIFSGKAGKEFILKSNSPSPKQTNDEISFKMKIDSAFSITGRGVVCSGRIESGNIKVGDFIDVEYLSGITVAKSFKVLGIEQFRKSLDTAQKGDNVGILLNTTSTEKIRENMVIVKRG